MIPAFLVYPWKENDIRYRLELATRLQRQGVSRVGVQFLFVNVNELAQMAEIRKRVAYFRQHVEPLFDEVVYSVHAPFLPYTECSLEMSETSVRTIRRIVRGLPVELDSVNVHLSHVGMADWQRLGMTYHKKMRNLDIIARRLRRLTRIGPPISIENLCAIAPSRDHVIYLGALPSDFDILFSAVPELKFTFDLCHSGITAKASALCKTPRDLKRAGLEGFFPDDLPELKRIRQFRDRAFLQFRDRLACVHVSDYQGLRHGAVPGRGERSTRYLSSLLAEIGQEANRASVVAEVAERDYARSPNTLRTLSFIGKAVG